MRHKNQALEKIEHEYDELEHGTGKVGREERGGGLLSHKWHKDFHASKINLNVHENHRTQPIHITEHEHHYPRLKVPRLLHEREGVYK